LRAARAPALATPLQSSRFDVVAALQLLSLPFHTAALPRRYPRFAVVRSTSISFLP
jgi:hypothetical protein